MTCNRDLALPYVAPYVVFVGVTSLLGKLHFSREISYLACFILTSLTLLWARRHYLPLRGEKSVVVSIVTGIMAGIIGLIAWIILTRPFIDTSTEAPWSLPAFSLHLAAAGLLVPVFEELLMRGFIFRFILQWEASRREQAADPFGQALEEKSINDLSPATWSWSAVIISSLIFAAGHHPHEWLAAVVYGGLMAGLMINRRDLLTPVIAHGVTNIGLGLYIYFTGSWYLW
jgi:membrane protease YdiL (CAAX protease family)